MVNDMNDEPKTDEEAWSVEPPKKVGSKKRKALRVALIVAVLAAAVAAGVVFYGGAIRDQIVHPEPMREPMPGDIIQVPMDEIHVD